MLSRISDSTLHILGLDHFGKSTSCFIETFAEIGWKDPFPCNLYDKEEPSLTIRPMVSFALPSKRLMLNIIRACMGISDPSKLWIN